ncbi:MAG TPA: chemotaxis protein CheW [Gammaproteobacteria bacterium]|nr:chemotaxis protein CheW [Gammaproteobacteria bacterium]
MHSETQAISNDDTGRLRAQPGKYLAFTVAGEAYGVDILRVREIRGWSRATRVPGAPDHVLGVLNLRGSIVPVIDMRARFGMELAEPTATTVIIVLCVHGGSGERDVGVVVDAVSDVFDVAAEALRPAPEFRQDIDVRAINGIFARENDMIMLLDIDLLVDSEAITGIDD